MSTLSLKYFSFYLFLRIPFCYHFIVISLLEYQWLKKANTSETLINLEGMSKWSEFLFMDRYGLIVMCPQSRNISVVDQKQKRALMMNLDPSTRVIGALRGIILMQRTGDGDDTVYIYCRHSLACLRTLRGYSKIINEGIPNEAYNIYIMRLTSNITAMVTKLQNDASEKFIWAGVDSCPSKQHRCSLQANDYTIQLLCLEPICCVATTVDLKTNHVIRRVSFNATTIGNNIIMNACGGLIIKFEHGQDFIICHKTGDIMYSGKVTMLYEDYMITEFSNRGTKFYARKDNGIVVNNFHGIWHVPKLPPKYAAMYLGSKGLLPGAIFLVNERSTRVFIVPLGAKKIARQLLLLPKGKYISGADGRSFSRLSFDPERGSCILEFSSLKRDKETIKEFLFG